MPREVERKFLVTGNGWRNHVIQTKAIRQAYLAATDRAQIRVRIVDRSSARLTIKSAGPDIDRTEFEYRIPLDETEVLFDLAISDPIEKRRRTAPTEPRGEWEIYEFGGRQEGLVLAEIELEDSGDDFVRPDWLGEEVTGDERYYNVDLAAR